MGQVIMALFQYSYIIPKNLLGLFPPTIPHTLADKSPNGKYFIV